MPDLVALTYSDMQSAASAGFLHPLEGLTNVLQDPDWYPVAREFGHYQNSEFGLPFASDALLTVYRPAAFDPPPSAWDAVFESGSYAAFPASDPKALFFLDLYLSAGGELTNDQGAIILDEELVIQVLSFFKEGLDKGAIPPEIKDHQTDVQTLQYFRGGYADLVVVSVTSDLATKSGQYMPVLGLNNLHYSLADGWVWSLAGADAEKLPVAAELAAYLVDSEYMSIWTKSAGYLPTRPQALAGWEEEDLETSLNEVLQSAHPVPLDQVLTVVGPLLQEAVVRVFNGEQVQVVARSVIESIQ
jgi:ABC-type glycerol-3-phosphate transport system substrate-binding protein